MPNPLAVLLIEDSPDDGLLTLHALESSGIPVKSKRVETAPQMRAALNETHWDITISDHSMPGFDALSALALLREHDSDMPFLIVSGAIGEEAAIAAMKAGASDYVMKDNLARLAPAVERELMKASERRARREAEREVLSWASIFESTAWGVALLGSDGITLELINEAFARLHGWAVEDLQGRTIYEIIAPQTRAEAVRAINAAPESGRHDFEGVHQRRDGSSFPAGVQVTVTAAPGGGHRRAVHVEDISARRHFEARLRHVADHDALTGLFNRRRFDEELERLIARAQRYDEPLTLLLLDLDNFKFANDTLGHGFGDEVLCAVARALESRLRETDVIARLGGDEFAVIFVRTLAPQAQAIAHQLLEGLHGSALGPRVPGMTASIGLATLDTGIDAETLLIQADVAMYQAKELGRNRVAFYTEGERERVTERSGWDERLRRALAEDGFELHAQPICDLRRNEVTQSELLLRLPNGSGGPLGPGLFLPAAERSGLIVDIDRWTITQAISLLRNESHDGRRLEVNVSGRSLGDESLLDMIEQQLHDSRIDPRRLILEITETAACANMDQAERFANRLVSVGCGFALDDFGTGFGSFYYLKHLPIDYLKIDGDFVRNLATSPTDQLIVRAILDVAAGLGIKTIAEFVANDETLRQVRSLGVDYAQGFHIGKPAALVGSWARGAAPEDN